MLRANIHIQDAFFNGRDVFDISILDKQDQNASKTIFGKFFKLFPSVSWLYRVQTSSSYRIFLHIIVFIHVLTGFGVYISADMIIPMDQYPSKFLLLTRAICLLIEFFHLLSWWTLDYIVINVKKIIKKKKIYGISKASFTIKLFISFIYIIAVIDLLTIIMFSKSIASILPTTPFLLLLLFRDTRRTAELFLLTTFKAKNILLLYFNLLVVASCWAIVSFSDTVNVGKAIGFSDIYRSFITLFIYMSTGDNYYDEVYPAVKANPTYMIFLTTVFIGTFFIIALLTAVYELNFSKMRKKDFKEDKIRELEALIACFLSLDWSQTQTLNAYEIYMFALLIRPALDIDSLPIDHLLTNNNNDDDDDVIYQSNHQSNQPKKQQQQKEQEQEQDLKFLHFKKFIYTQKILEQNKQILGLKHKKDKQSNFHKKDEVEVDIYTFIPIVRHILIHPVLLEHPLFRLHPHQVLSYQKLKYYLYHQFIASGIFKFIGVINTIINICASCMIGLVTAKTEKIANTISWLCYIIFLLEISIKLFCFGPKIYWYYHRYHRNHFEQMFAYRFELLLAIISLLYPIIYIIAHGMYHIKTEVNLHLITIIPILRVLVQSNRCRHLLYTLMNIIPVFYNMFLILWFTLYIYSSYATVIFKDKLDPIAQNDTLPSNYDTLTHSLLIMFQLMLGDMITDIVYIDIKVTDWSVALFFISYILIMVFLINSLFIGSIMSIFSESVKKQNATKAELLKVLYHHEEEKDDDDDEK